MNDDVPTDTNADTVNEINDDQQYYKRCDVLINIYIAEQLEEKHN